ncbi:hypothetical protein [Streptomyces sp. NPDC051569]|uniref:hypothetical protein n=1 Tax=Streptomyces sp. NPDC051569 TaxID=3365661 RepID=UPI0037963CEB
MSQTQPLPEFSAERKETIRANIAAAHRRKYQRETGAALQRAGDEPNQADALLTT